MPLQNRVTPEGEIVADPSRGLMMGNRGGALHDPNKSLGRRRWVSRQWICCLLSFNNRHREVMAPRRYTELFFLDEATALAAGHRPCFECRRQDFIRFASLWARVRQAHDRATAQDMDRVLQADRVDSTGRKITYREVFDRLPDGTFVRLEEAPHLVMGHTARAWTPKGYQSATGRSTISGKVDVLTPRSIVEVLSAGYTPAVHPSAAL